MSRESTGSIKWMRNVKTGKPQWHARFSKGPRLGRTKYIAIAANIPEHDREGALADARRWAAKARVAPAAGGAETFEQYAGRWIDDREGRVHSVRDDRSRMTHHVAPVLGPLDARTFTRDDVERLRDKLDARIAAGALSWKTAANVWTLVTSMCADMTTAKRREFRIRDDNPCRDVKAPDRGARKAKQFLFPSEFVTFASCEDVPLRWRRAVAVAIYTFLRDSELRVMKWQDGDVDLEHGTLSVTRAYNRRTKTEKGTKTGHSRRFAIEPALLPLLQVLHDEKGGEGALVTLASERAMARNLRRWLWKAGVQRPELHEGSPTRKPLTWHDLRATGATWMAVRGDDPLKIKQRCGHTTFSTTELYVREAENLREGFGTPFPPLPADLLGGAGSGLPRQLPPNCHLPRKRSRRAKNKAFVAGWTGLEESCADR